MKHHFRILIFSTVYFFYLTSCQNPADPTLVENLECTVNARQNSDCYVSVAGEYVYTSQYGGRSANGAASLSPANGAKIYTPPTGWYSGSNISFSDSALSAGDIKSGVSLFGITGTYVTTASGACNMSGGGGLQGGNCTTPAGTFIYTTAYNGRSANCAIDTGATNGAICWLNPSTSITVTTTPPTTAPACSVTGQQATTCTAPASSYYYTSDTGGRALDCVSGYNAAACWLTTTGNMIVTGGVNSCTYNTSLTSSCVTNAGEYVYSSSYGGRNATCTNDGLGNCFVTQASKALLEPNLIADNVKLGVSIFGILGKYSGPNSWFSGAFHVLGSNPISFGEETTNFAGSAATPNLPAGYHSIPSFATNDNEGYTGVGVTLQNRTGWGASTCGYIDKTANVTNLSDCISGLGSTAGILVGQYITASNVPGGTTVLAVPGTCPSGQVQMSAAATGTAASIAVNFMPPTTIAKITHCVAVFGTGAIWDGSLNGNAGQVTWKLVTRTGANSSGKGREVWQDTKTGLLWSSLISTNINWCKASGSSNASGVAAANKEADPDAICDNATYQDQTTAQSACFEGTGFANSDPAIDNAGKTGMALTATHPLVAWRIPTMYDYEIADYHGIRFILPDMGANGSGEEWTGTLSSINTTQAWTYSSTLGSHSSRSRTSGYSVRCVGR